MKPIYIDFAPRLVKRSLLLTHATSSVFVVIGLLLCGSAAVSVYGMMNRYALEAEAQRIQARQVEVVKYQSVQNTWSIPEAQVTSVNNAIAQLNLPWRDLLDSIETATTANIALLAIEPDSKKQMVKGMAEAKTSQEMISYIQQLKKQEFFGSVILTKHEINDQDVNKPYRFQFEAQWVIDGRRAQ